MTLRYTEEQALILKSRQLGFSDTLLLWLEPSFQELRRMRKKKKAQLHRRASAEMVRAKDTAGKGLKRQAQADRSSHRAQPGGGGDAGGMLPG